MHRDYETALTHFGMSIVSAAATPRRRLMAILALAILSLMTTGCLEVQSQPPLPQTTMSSWGPMGGFTMSSGSQCAGKTTLRNGGRASVSDSCFTSRDNIVMCTDASVPNPVSCTPGSGYLSISGTDGDTIAYVRVH